MLTLSCPCLGHPTLSALQCQVGPLQNFLEGRPATTGVRITNNVFHGFGSSPIHIFAAQAQAENNTWIP